MQHEDQPSILALLGFDAARVVSAGWEPSIVARTDADGMTHITAQAKSHAGSINTVLEFTRTVADGPAILARCTAMDNVANELPVDDSMADVREAICNVRDGLGGIAMRL